MARTSGSAPGEADVAMAKRAVRKRVVNCMLSSGGGMRESV